MLNHLNTRTAAESSSLSDSAHNLLIIEAPLSRSTDSGQKISLYAQTSPVQSRNPADVPQSVVNNVEQASLEIPVKYK